MIEHIRKVFAGISFVENSLQDLQWSSGQYTLIAYVFHCALSPQRMSNKLGVKAYRSIVFSYLSYLTILKSYIYHHMYMQIRRCPRINNLRQLAAVFDLHGGCLVYSSASVKICISENAVNLSTYSLMRVSAYRLLSLLEFFILSSANPVICPGHSSRCAK